MGRHSCCYKQKLRKGLWSPEEDEKLLNYITKHGHGCWSSVPKLAGTVYLCYILYMVANVMHTKESLGLKKIIPLLYGIYCQACKGVARAAG